MDLSNFLIAADGLAALLLPAICGIGVYSRLRARGRPALGTSVLFMCLSEVGIVVVVTGTVLLDIELGDNGFRSGQLPRTREVGALFVLVGIFACVGAALLIVNWVEPGFFRPRHDLAKDYDDRMSPDPISEDPTDAGR